MTKQTEFNEKLADFIDANKDQFFDLEDTPMEGNTTTLVVEDYILIVAVRDLGSSLGGITSFQTHASFQYRIHGLVESVLRSFR